MTHNYIGYSYYGSELGYAADKGGMPTSVVGNPFSVEKASFDRAVTEAMSLSLLKFVGQASLVDDAMLPS